MAAFPVLFVDHGSPMEALEASPYTEALASVPSAMRARPRGIVVVSAHWETRGSVHVTSAAEPSTIHDFYGFPDALYQIEYPAKGNAALAIGIVDRLTEAGIRSVLDPKRGLDHGTWVPLRHVFPDADVPVVQVSLPVPRDEGLVERMGQALAPLRDEGVLLFASGGIVHNIPLFLSGMARRVMPALTAFDRSIRERLQKRDLRGLRAYAVMPGAELAVPTSEHFDPLFFAAGAAGGDAPRWLHGGSGDRGISMNVVLWGG